MKRQRVGSQQGAITDERLQILNSMGFEFGEQEQLTEEWENRFDDFVEWMLWNVGFGG